MITISQYQAMLEDLKNEVGDVGVVTTNMGSAVMGAVLCAHGPVVQNLSIPTGREHVLRVHLSGDAEVKRGVKVVRLA